MPFRSPPRQSPFSLTPWVRGLIISNVVVYLLTITVLTGGWVGSAFALHPGDMNARWWTMLTYMFLHDGFLHLAFNMLMLFFFGPAVEERLGGSSFGLFYFTCGFGGAVVSLLLESPGSSIYIVGASGAILGVALAFALFWPNAPIYIFPLPVPIKVKWLVGFLVVVNLFMARASVNTGIAWSTHVGGLLFGFIYIASEERVVRRSRQVMIKPLRTSERRRRKEKVGAKQQQKQAAPDNVQSIHKKRDDDLDRVLDKISESGIESLTPSERTLLEEESQKLRRD